MELMDLLNLGAKVIQGNSDDTTTGIDVGSIASALGSVLGNGSEGVQETKGLDISSIIAALASSGALQKIVTSWVGSGENEAISGDQVTELLGSDKVKEFASQLGLSEDSAKGALADALPQIIDKATNEDSSLASSLLEQVGGINGAMDMLGKFMGKA
ncbi:conserved hypothetical protein [Sulfurovum sp. enrichment culture clone C5]|uniref:DUF937 domain-containing protein n=1 Tax=Sulfurovum sp. enrichment culture clone C5 TaxID=497650 RepID=A0A0S4XQ90_9BACT|nr:conserved hypothetical protein [Sulfurovum sp. enrichment culture clone C5]